MISVNFEGNERNRVSNEGEKLAESIRRKKLSIFMVLDGTFFERSRWMIDEFV
jgi:hypothetical protein